MGKLPNGEGGDCDKLLMLPRCCCIVPGGIPIGPEEEKAPVEDSGADRELLTELLSLSRSRSSSRAILVMSKSSMPRSSKAFPARYRRI